MFLFFPDVQADDGLREIMDMSTDDIISRARLLENECKVRIFVTCTNVQIMKSEVVRLGHEQEAMKEKVKVRIYCFDNFQGKCGKGEDEQAASISCRQRC